MKSNGNSGVTVGKIALGVFLGLLGFAFLGHLAQPKDPFLQQMEADRLELERFLETSK